MRFWNGCLLFVMQGMASACYVYSPAPATPVPGTRVLLELNDQGRVGLGDSIGPSSQVVEGTVMSLSDSAYGVRVVRVGYLNGQSNQWNGEPLMVSKAFVGNARERRFSRSRTWLTAGGVTAAAIAFIASRGLLGFGSEVRNNGNPPPNGQ
jgi:hypothetical protein